MDIYTLAPGRWKVIYRTKPTEVIESDGTATVDMREVVYVFQLLPLRP